MICSKCNAVLPDDSVFCPECGSKITGQKVVTRKEEKDERAIINLKIPLLSLCVLTTIFLLRDYLFAAYLDEKINAIVFLVIVLIGIILLFKTWGKLIGWIFSDDKRKGRFYRKTITIAICVVASILANTVLNRIGSNIFLIIVILAVAIFIMCWINGKFSPIIAKEWTCTCGYKPEEGEKIPKFCPECGAKME